MSENPDAEAIQVFLRQVGLPNDEAMFDEIFDRAYCGDPDIEGIVRMYEIDMEFLSEAQREEVRAWIRGIVLLP